MRRLLLAVALLPIGAWAVWPLLGVGDAPISTELWLLVAVSALANIFVLHYHYTTPPHPKFTMLGRRRAWLRVHVISGVLELLAGLAVFALPGHAWPGVLMATIALAAHVPSSIAQNSIVAGSRALMVPGYIAGIAAHGFCALMLLLHPTSLLWAVNTFLLFNTYAWVRIYGFVFMRLRLFASSRYTIMVLAAGLTTMTPVFGPLLPVKIGVMLAVYIGLQRLFAREPAAYDDFVRERSRWSSIHDDLRRLWSSDARAPTQRRLARQLFDTLAVDGRLAPAAIEQLLSAWPLPEQARAALLERLDAADGLDFEGFCARLWSLASVREQAGLVARLRAPASAVDEARVVFDMLDLDDDGVITDFELRLLLLEWNLPSDETQRYFEVCDRDHDGRIDFEDFHRSMQPVWRYIYDEVLQPRAADLRARYGSR